MGNNFSDKGGKYSFDSKDIPGIDGGSKAVNRAIAKNPLNNKKENFSSLEEYIREPATDGLFEQ